jgi:zinc protease
VTTRTLVFFLFFLFSSPALAGTPQQYILDNGLRLVVHEDPSHPVVSLHAYVGCGSSTEGEWIASGISHFVEHMLFKGTENRAVGEIAKEIEGLGGSINATTSFDATRYFLTLPSRHAAKAIEIMSDALFYSSFDADELEKEREVILGEFRLNQDNPTRLLSKSLWKTAYLRHPYQHPVIGYESLFSEIAREDLMYYYRQHYIPNNIVLAIAGDISSEEVYALTKKHFGAVSRRFLPQRTLPKEPPQLSERQLDQFLPIQNIYSMIGYHGPELNHPDLYAMDVLAIILGQGRSSRLVDRLKEEEELVLSISAASYTPHDPGLFLISATLEPDLGKKESWVDRVAEEISQIETFGVSDLELKKAKQQVLSDFYFSQQSTSGKAADLASSWSLTGDTHFSDRYVKGIQEVTAGAIQTVLQKYFGNHRRTVVHLIPEFLQNETTPDDKDKPLGEIHNVTLKNRLEIIYQSIPDLPIVNIEVVMRGGTSFEKRPGLSQLMSHLLLRGTGKHTAYEFAETIESIGASWGTSSGHNSIGVSAAALSEHLPLLLTLMGEVLSESTFPKEEIEKIRTRTLATINAEADSVFQTGGRLLRKSLFGDTPFGYPAIGTRESIQEIQQEDLKKFYRETVTTQNMAISIIGDIDETTIVDQVQKAFYFIPAKTPPRLPKANIQLLTRTPETSKKMPGKEQTLLLMGFPTPLQVDHPDRFAISIMNKVLSGQGGRLFRRIRDELGLAYTLGAYHVYGTALGYEVIYVATTQEKLSQSKQVVAEEIRRIQSGKITSEELEEAKTYLMGAHEISLQTHGALAKQTALNTLYKLGFDAHQRYAQHINEVSADDITRVAKTYLEANNLSTVVVGP